MTVWLPLEFVFGLGLGLGLGFVISSYISGRNDRTIAQDIHCMDTFTDARNSFTLIQRVV